eukprot:4590238-Pyramimonas_sp.AAC.2
MDEASRPLYVWGVERTLAVIGTEGPGSELRLEAGAAEVPLLAGEEAKRDLKGGSDLKGGASDLKGGAHLKGGELRLEAGAAEVPLMPRELLHALHGGVPRMLQQLLVGEGHEGDGGPCHERHLLRQMEERALLAKCVRPLQQRHRHRHLADTATSAPPRSLTESLARVSL